MPRSAASAAASRPWRPTGSRPATRARSPPRSSGWPRRPPRAAVDAQRQAVDTLRQSILNDTNAIGANTKAQVVNDLQRSGALKLAATAGLNLSNVTGAAQGNGKAKAALNKQLTTVEQQALTAPGGLISSTTGQAIAKLLPILKSEGILVGKAGVEADLTAAATGKLSFATRSVADQTTRYGHTLQGSSIQTRANIKFIRDHVTALDTQLTKGKLTNNQWVTQIGTLQKQLHQYGFNSKQVQTYVAQFAKVPKSVITSLLADPKIANSALGQVLRLIGHVPKAKNTTLTATDHASATATGLGQILDTVMAGRTVVLDANITANAERAARILDKFGGKAIVSARNVGVAGLATGGIVNGGGTGTSDTAGVFALSRGEAVIPEKAVSRNRGLVHALIKAGRGLASGGIVGNYQALASLLASLGATKAGIAGWLGNTKIESGGSLNPSSGPAHGLQQCRAAGSRN